MSHNVSFQNQRVHKKKRSIGVRGPGPPLCEAKDARNPVVSATAQLCFSGSVNFSLADVNPLWGLKVGQER